MTRRVAPSSVRTGVATLSTSGNSAIRPVRSRTAEAAAAASSGPDREEIITCSVGRRCSPPSVAIRFGVPASPTQKSSVVAALLPTAVPAPRHRMTETNQPVIERHGCLALQRAIRTG